MRPCAGRLQKLVSLTLVQSTSLSMPPQRILLLEKKIDFISLHKRVSVEGLVHVDASLSESKTFTKLQVCLVGVLVEMVAQY